MCFGVCCLDCCGQLIAVWFYKTECNYPGVPGSLLNVELFGFSANLGGFSPQMKQICPLTDTDRGTSPTRLGLVHATER